MEGRVPEDLAAVIDARGAIVAWSEGARRLLGYAPAEVIGEPATSLLAADLPGAAWRRLADGRRWSSEVALLPPGRKPCRGAAAGHVTGGRGGQAERP